MILSHIVAVSKNNVIGVNNELPWNIPEDMKFFRDKTKGRVLIMGRKTFESVGHPLPNRFSIVITRQKNYSNDAKNVAIVSHLTEALELARSKTSEFGDEVFIIGGGEIFKESIDIVDTIYLTRIHKDFSGDILYPHLDPKKFERVEARDRTEPVPFTFETYTRKK